MTEGFSLTIKGGLPAASTGVAGAVRGHAARTGTIALYSRGGEHVRL